MLFSVFSLSSLSLSLSLSRCSWDDVVPPSPPPPLLLSVTRSSWVFASAIKASHGFFFSKPKKATFLLSSHRVGIQDYEFPEAKIGILSQEYKHGKENRCRTLEYEVALEGFSYVFLFYNYELWDLNISGEKLEEICIRWEFDSSDDSRCGIYCTLRWSIHDFLEGFFI
ncbi:uncharacterized protein LOC112174580 isoform X2 [Rosa chinensis]|uniref:uncharacterized protein LOC112174580 isoform X2 n=1 Tax=Rosa chinensis TaxID=74649 RepID=UPI001AD91F62|nr:uncharacterized protein LOC112174580 isoform X2 [Rosa chinensis]